MDINRDPLPAALRTNQDVTRCGIRAFGQPRFNRLIGVHEKVHQDLLDLHRITAHKRNIVVVLIENHRVLHHGPDDARSRVHAVIDIRAFAIPRILMREIP